MKRIIRFNKYVFLIVFACLFMSVGYAAISAVNLNITGDAMASASKGVFITDVSCTNNSASNTINSYSGTILDSTVTINNLNGNVQCYVTVHNNTDYDYYYDETIYDDDGDYFYDNDDITFDVNLNKTSSVSANSSLTFTVNFHYATGVYSITNSTLNSLLYFKFSQLSTLWYENCYRQIDTIRCKLITAETPYSDTVSSTYVSSSSGINFNAVSSTTNGRGLYYVGDTTRTEDLDGDGAGDRLYYYRGNVTNNYLLFSGFCWRIVRINEDGSVKLIYGGTPTNGSCPQTGTNVNIGSSAFNTYSTRDNAYVGYMYGSTGASNYANAHRNTNSSTIKTEIDSWYSSNLSGNTAYLADSFFCADRKLTSGNGYGTSTSVYAPENRFYANSSNQVPYIKCDQDNDKFSVSSENGNGALTYPIALLTADEAVYAGSRYATSGTNSDTFLYSSAFYWLLSPGDLDSDGPYVHIFTNAGFMRLRTTSSTTYNNNTFYVRPVINLKGTSKFSAGTGTYNNPYTLDGFAVDTGNGDSSGGGDDPGPGGDDPPTPSTIWYENCTSSSTTLNCKMITATTPASDSSISFSAFSSSSNGNGLYYTSDLTKTEDTDSDGTGERVYYYRGAVTNNFVLFANYCWRIIRTNEDSTVRLIYGGSPSNGSCPQNGSAASIGNSAFNSTANDNAYVGYMYGTRGASTYNATHANTNNSTIKTTIDNWYSSNLSSYSSYLADEVFCNDRATYRGNGYGTSNTVYAGNNRLNANKNPTLKCSQNNDKFTVNSSNGNGALTYPIGLITADEMNYLGSMFNTTTTGANNHFLYTGSGMWTMTPSDYYNNYFYGFYMNTTGELRIANNLTTSYAVRPVINMVSTVKVTSGTGAYNSPYQLSLS